VELLLFHPDIYFVITDPQQRQRFLEETLTSFYGGVISNKNLASKILIIIDTGLPPAKRYSQTVEYITRLRGQESKTRLYVEFVFGSFGIPLN